MREAGYWLVCVLSAAVAGYAFVIYAFMPLGATILPEMRETYEAHRVGIYAHVFGAFCALALGPWQFSTRLRAANVTLHRWLGRLYLGLGVLVGGIAGLYMAFHAFGGIVARAGFACLALGWLYTGARAYLAIRAGRVAEHRAWMIRNFSLTLAAVMLRLYIPASLASGIAFETAYPVVAWLCWVPNAIFAQWMIERDRLRPAPVVG
jgi:uncharacterized membrane protein